MFDELIGLVVAGVAVTATAIVGAVVSHRKKKGKQLENAGQGYHFDNDISEEEDDDGFDSHGRDRAGKSKSYYKEEVGKLQQALGTIKKRTDEKDFDSALLSIRKSLEKAIKLYLEHWNGSYRGENLYSLIDECEDDFDEDSIGKLHSVRMHCNDGVHDSGEKKKYNQVYFCYKVLDEMIGQIWIFAF